MEIFSNIDSDNTEVKFIKNNKVMSISFVIDSSTPKQMKHTMVFDKKRRHQVLEMLCDAYYKVLYFNEK